MTAYSGGVDSAFLAAVAGRVLGDRALAVTAASESLAPDELTEACEVAVQFGFKHEVVHTNELRDENYAANPLNRCYFCKSELMAKLTELGFLTLVRQGKHRYYQLANAQVATALEALLQLSATTAAGFTPGTPPHLRYARSCYDHLAGTVAVALHDQLLREGWLITADNDQPPGNRHYQLSANGEKLFTALQVELKPKPNSRRQYACACLDWSERKSHLGGYLGAALLEMMLAQQWLLREPDDRVLHLTAKGQKALQQHFALSLPSRN